MTSRDFAYWLNGFLELSAETKINEEQIKMIKEHLALVFRQEVQPLQPPFLPTYPGISTVLTC